MQRAHRIALDPTNTQAGGLARAAGCARKAYNWALARWQEQYAYSTYPELGEVERPSQYSLRRELNAIKREEFPWMLESTKCAPQEAIISLGVAFQNFFAGRAKYPRFKKKGVRDSFKLSSGQFLIEGRRIRVPKIGWIRMREAVRYADAKHVSVTISRTAGRWYASVQCEFEEPEYRPVEPGTVGVDVGVREYIVSTGIRHEVPRSLRDAQRKLRRAQQTMSRRQKGSSNRAKARAKVARLHARVVNVRQDWLHQLTTQLTNDHDRIVIEDLNVRGMVRNHRLAMSIMDAGFHEFRRQLEYKTSERGTALVVADRWFPSSKLCSTCGAKTKHLTLSQREWTCGKCNTMNDRDLNAARNLAAYDPAASSAVAACGELFTADQQAPSGANRSSDLYETGISHQTSHEHV